ncbi:hypothetical protein Pst134EA_015895 [Puccinia striiformis f. sp. tritici]|nr:hypothetical protein Pst134EA_015895 [Puccinia striiformis f. sp. tritici]KAH9463814.1 hypothetical protein Pst134EA_015895 [Puccinia striiformis f. sp. tritici]
MAVDTPPESCMVVDTPPESCMAVDTPPDPCMAVDDPVPENRPFVVGQPGLANISDCFCKNVGVNPLLVAPQVPPSQNPAPPPSPAAPGFGVAVPEEQLAQD